MKVLRRITARTKAADMLHEVGQVIQKHTGLAAAILRLGGAKVPEGWDINAAAEELLDIAVTPARRLPKRLVAPADKIALLMFDAWCKDDGDCMRSAPTWLTR
jgi:hypothetical protein